MLKNIMNNVLGNQANQNKDNNNNLNMQDMLKLVMGKNPQELEDMAKNMMKTNGGLNKDQMQQFENLAKMFGATDRQINDFKNKL